MEQQGQQYSHQLHQLHQQEQPVVLVESVHEMHDVFTLVSLLLVLAIVWRLGVRPQNSMNLPLRKRIIFGNSSGIFIGLGFGILLAQIPSFMFLSRESVGASLFRKLQEEPLSFSPCVVGANLNRTTVPAGAEGLPPGMIVSTTDLYMRRLTGKPEGDLPTRPRYILVLSAAYKSAVNVDRIVTKLKSKDWSIVLFHEDGKVDDWLEYPWANEVIHVAAQQQSKWWFAKRFLHPDALTSFDYLFLWNPDIDVTDFDPTAYISLVNKYGLEISQPAVEPEKGSTITWQMTKRLEGVEVHRETEERPGWCIDKQKPPCAGFVEISVPVFSRKAWRCVWHLIQNDLVHGWGLDFSLGLCAQGPAHQNVGVVDAQYIRLLHPTPTNADPEEIKIENTMAEDILERSKYEWEVFKARLAAAEDAIRDQVPKTEPRVIIT